MKRGSLALAASLLVSLVAVIWVLGEADVTQVIDALGTVAPVPALTAAAMAACAMTLRSLRWAYLAAARRRELPVYWTAVIFGLLGNTALPLRAGEAIRIAVLAKLTMQRFVHATASSAVDRANDVVAVAVIILLVGGVHASTVVSPEAVGGAAAILLAGIAVVLLVIRFGDSTYAAVERSLVRLRLPWHGVVLSGLRQIVVHIRHAGSPQRGFFVLVFNALIVACDCAFYYLMFLAMGWSLPWDAALVVWVVVAIGISLPTAPAYIGVYQAACIIALAQFGVDATPALAFALASQAVDVAVMGALGAIAAPVFIRAASRPRVSRLQ